MSVLKINRLADILSRHQSPILEDWLREQFSDLSARQDLISENDLRSQSKEFLAIFTPASRTGSHTDITALEWKPVVDLLSNISRSRAIQGFSPSETATVLMDKLGLFTTEVYQKTREDAIKRQQVELLELSTPVIKVLGRHSRSTAHRHPRQRPITGSHGKSFASYG